MAYICFIESRLSAVPHMEPLLADDAGTAMERARRLMAEHSNAIAAHVFFGDERIATLTADDAPPKLRSLSRRMLPGRRTQA